MKLFASYRVGSQGMAHYNVAVKRDLFSSPSFYADLQQSLEWAVTPYRNRIIIAFFSVQGHFRN